MPLVREGLFTRNPERRRPGGAVLRFGLKAKFSLNLLIILLVAMFLLDFVIMMITRQALIRAESEKAQVALSALEAIAFTPEKRLYAPQGLSGTAADIKAVMQASRIVCGRLEDDLANSYQWGGNCPEAQALSHYAGRAVSEGKTILEFIGSTWGLLYERSQYMVVAAPVTAGERPRGTICLIYDLGTVYASLGKTQKIIFYYILINALLLTFFGVYRLWQITGKPLQKLVRRADEFQPDGDLLFLSDEEESEFNKLSRSLNRMLENIDADKKKLKSTVLSLEAANAELKQAHKEIIRAEKMASVGRLSSGIAHEIGNPIGIVLGYLDLLRQEDLAADHRADYIERAQAEIGRINEIIRELLDFSRPAPEIEEEVSIHAIIEEISEMLRQQPMMRDIELHCNLSAAGHFVKADPQRLRQVFLNLLINASDAICQGGEPIDGNILIESRDIQQGPAGTKFLQVVVADDGPGIPDSELQNVFDPFYTTKEPGKGTGLGLSVCFMIVEEAGGTLQVESAETQWTRFIMTFPIIERN
jgi:signal transduction histidine kinase